MLLDPGFFFSAMDPQARFNLFSFIFPVIRDTCRSNTNVKDRKIKLARNSYSKNKSFLDTPPRTCERYKLVHHSRTAKRRSRERAYKEKMGGGWEPSLLGRQVQEPSFVGRTPSNDYRLDRSSAVFEHYRQ